MPNWCSNEVEIKVDPEYKPEFDAFIKRARLDNNKPSKDLFNKIHPLPRHLKDTNHTFDNKEEFNKALQGDTSAKYSDWYTWRLANWGTKWDVDPDHVDIQEHSVLIAYDTAWSPAEAVWEKVSKDFPHLNIRVKYFEEGNDFIGESEYYGGDKTKDICLSFSTEMYVAAGAVLDEDGSIDWDVDQCYNLWDLFDAEGGLEKFDGR